MPSFVVGSVALLLVAPARVCRALPYRPADDAQVLERLPVSAADPAERVRRDLRHALAAQPDDLALAQRLAWAYIEQGRTRSDPRFYGYAEAVLEPWWNLPKPPSAVLVLRATVRQHRHDFDAALADLSLALQADPRDAQAWLTQALIRQVRGEYEHAKRSCVALLGLSDPLLATTCAASVGSLTGAAEPSYDLLRKTLERTGHSVVETRLWALTVLAEIAVRLGRVDAAERHFRQALALGQRDDYLLTAYADFLLDQRRPEAVVALLRDRTQVDGLLLRLALAEQRLGQPTFAAHCAELAARFAAGHQRGEAVHQREEARFVLHCRAAPPDALRLAQANWAVQREPADARILLETALAAAAPDAAQPVLEFVDGAGLQDVALASLRVRLRAATR